MGMRTFLFSHIQTYKQTQIHQSALNKTHNLTKRQLDRHPTKPGTGPVNHTNAVYFHCYSSPSLSFSSHALHFLTFSSSTRIWIFILTDIRTNCLFDTAITPRNSKYSHTRASKYTLIRRYTMLYEETEYLVLPNHGVGQGAPK